MTSSIDSSREWLSVRFAGGNRPQILRGLLAVALASPSVFATELFTWDGGTGNWEDANWNGGQAGPGYELNGNLDPGVGQVPNALINSGTVNLTETLLINDDNTEPAKVTLDGGASLTGSANLIVNWNGALLEILDGDVTLPWIQLNGGVGDSGDVLFDTGTVTLTDGNGLRTNSNFPDNVPGFNFVGEAGAGMIVYTLNADVTRHLANKVAQDLFAIDGTKIAPSSTYNGTQGSLDTLNDELAANVVNGRYFQISGDLTSGGTQTLVLVESTRPAATSSWTATASDFWEVGGFPNGSPNWSSPDQLFFNGDNITFGDTGVDSLFTGTVEIVSGIPSPGSISFPNNTQDYIIDGEIGGDGPITKTGTGLVTFLAPDSNMPFSGDITMDSGVFELGNESGALRNASATVNPGATFRLLQTTTGQDFNNPALTLAGGTLDIEDRSFYYNALILADGTTSTINTDEELLTWSGPVETAFAGTGNLVKTGADFLAITGRDAVYTGTTTIEEGEFRIAANRTVASTVWTLNGGMLRLLDDNEAPIQNMPDTSSVSLSGATFDVTGNTETIGSLLMDASVLTVGNTGAGTTTALLTVDILDLTGTENLVTFSPVAAPGTYGVLRATTVNGTLGTNLLVAGIDPSLQSWSYSGGLVSVTIADASKDIAYTNSSGNAMWTIGGDTDWTDGSAVSYADFDNVTFDDSASGLPLAVAIAAPVAPGSVTFNNTTGNDYTFTGAAIVGPSGVTMNGNGTVTLAQPNSYVGETLVNSGTLVLDSATRTLADGSSITINSGATVQSNRTNAIFRDSSDAVITINGGTLEFTETAAGTNTHAHLPSMILRNGATVTATSGGAFAQVNTDFDGNVTVEGSTPSNIGPFNLGIRFNNFTPEFNVADVTGDPGTDLFVDTRMRGNQGFIKSGAGTMFIAANPDADTDYNTTAVNEGCLVIEALSAIPADLTRVTVAAGAGFGGVAGASNLTDADFEAMATSVVWDANGDARLVIDTGGNTVTVAADLAGNFDILAKGGGTLNLTGNLAVNEVLSEPGTTVNVGGGQGSIAVRSISTVGNGATYDVSLTFDSVAAVDIYTSTDLSAWSKLNPSPVPGGTGAGYTATDVTGARRFFIIVPAGSPYPAP